MFISLVGRQNTRLAYALFSFLASLSLLIFMFRDDITVFQPVDEETYLRRVREKATIEALDVWHSWNASTEALKNEPPPENAPFGDVVIAGQQSTDLSWNNVTKVK